MEKEFIPSDEQAYIIQQCLEPTGNIFITGSGGVGKSTLLKHVTKALQEKHGAEFVHVTASTGIAATHIEGVTVHSFAGGGNLDNSLASCITNAQRTGADKKWYETKVLIIDEISMLERQVFEKIEAMANRLRSHVQNQPFGGIKLIVTGDFFQLPPVTRNRDYEYAFQSPVWTKCRFETFVLTKIFRQDHEDFIRMLQRVRVGMVDEETISMIESRLNAPVSELKNGIQPTRLYCTNARVDEENDRELKMLGPVSFSSPPLPPPQGGGEQERQTLFTFIATDKKGTRDKLDKSMLTPYKLELKVGAQVMLLKNMCPPLLVNGSRGVIIDFKPLDQVGKVDYTRYPVVLFQNGTTMTCGVASFKLESAGRVVGERIQVPLKLAWALTIHKSQGMTLDAVVMDLTRAFGAGQVYVALSRCTSLHGISLKGFDARKIYADPRVVQFYADLGDPLAREALQNGGAKRQKMAYNISNMGNTDTETSRNDRVSMKTIEDMFKMHYNDSDE
jgi:ATP-dependent DNA helicase PIF1